MKRVRHAVTAALLFSVAVCHAWDAVPQKVADGVYAFVGETGPRTVANFE